MSAPRITTRFAALEPRGILLGLTGGQLGLLGTGLLIMVGAGYTAASRGLLIAAPVVAVLVFVGLWPVADRTPAQWVPLLAGWGIRGLVPPRLTHVAPPRAAGEEVVVPGLTRPLRLVESRVGTGLVHDARTGTVVALLRVSGPGLLLADPDAQAQLVTGWGRWLAQLCQQPAVVRVQVLARTAPGSVSIARQWWHTHAAQAARTVTGRLAAELLTDADTEVNRYDTVLVVALRTPNRKAMEQHVVSELSAVLESLASAASTAGLAHDGWADPAGVAGWLRAGFDPYSLGGRDHVVTTPAVAGMCLRESWDRVRTDSGWHAVFWVRQWPRSDVDPGFLAGLLTGGTRALSLVIEPVPLTKALREIRRSRVEHAAESAQRARIGQLDSATAHAAETDVLAREAELVAGHADLRYTGLLTVTAPTSEQLDAACAALEGAAAQAMCELRRLVGQQAAGFLAGAVPLARSTS